MVIVKTVLSPFLFPLPLGLAVLIIGIALLWTKRRQKLGRILVTAGCGFLLLLSLGPVADGILSPFERQYHAFGPADSLLAVREGVQYVVVLGGGHVSDPLLPPSGRLKANSAVRLLEGIRIHRALHGTRLLLSGGSIFDPHSNAEAMRDVALQLGVPEEEIMLQVAPTNTEEEILSLKQRIGDAPVVVVTSASHMPRAVGMFAKLGMHPIPAPTDQLVKRRQEFDPTRFIPKAINLLEAERASYEFYGTLWARLRGNL